MTTSGSYNFAVSADDIVTAALKKLNAIAAGETPGAEELADGRFSLNLILKNIMGPNNAIMPGLKVWLRKATTLTLTATAQYQLKPSELTFTSGGTYEPSVGDTITGATSAATATIIEIDVTTGTWAGGDAAGTLTIKDQSGTFEAENLDIGTNSNFATISADSSQGGGGKDIPIPVTIESAFRRNTDDVDTPMDPMTASEYHSIGAKSASGTPQKYLYERKLDAGYFTLDRVPSDTTDTIVINYLVEVEDFDTGTDDAQVSKEYYRPLMWLLADELSPEYPVDQKILTKIEKKVLESLSFAQTFKPDEIVAYFEPDRDD